jgi:hypothetical protein
LGNIANAMDLQPKSAAAVTAWQLAAVAALQPSMTKLLPESLVQLLTGCKRIAAGVRDLQPQQQQQGHQQTPAQQLQALQQTKQTSTAGSSTGRGYELVQTVLSAAVGLLSGRLDDLDSTCLVYFMSGCAAVEAASQELGASILTRIEPELRCDVGLVW